MWSPPRIARLSCALVLLALSSCVGDSPVQPMEETDLNLTAPQAAIIDGSTTGSDAFFFLPPLVGNPNVSGDFNPNLLPTMTVCEIDGGPCTESNTVASFSEGSIEASSGQYQFNWDTDGPETGNMNANKFYRVEVAVGGTVMGSIDIDPQRPNGPGQGEDGYYAFRVGETIPVKFWLSTETLCEGTGYVIECITGSVLDENGGTLALDSEGDRLSVYLPQDGLPGTDHPPITVVIERLDPDLFLTNEGEECLPFFDAPQFGPCFRVTTYPELTAPLQYPALISICIDPTSLSGVKVPEDQEDQLQIVRFASDGSGQIQALSNVAADCPIETASLIDVPEDGIFRYAALGLNKLAELLGPQPLAAHGEISLGGLTSSFSRFRFALPGQMTATGGDGTIIQDGDDNEVDVQVQVLDHEGIPVQNGTVHFGTGDGSISATDVLTDVDGYASITWIVDDATPGTKELTASAKGLRNVPIPNHSTTYDFVTEAVTFTATVVGPPAAIAASPSTPLAGTAGEVAGTVSITVTDAGTNPVAGASVTWSPSGDGSVSGTTETDGSGNASADWTLSTTAGDNTLEVTVGGVAHTFEATGAAGDAAFLLVVDGDGQTGYVGGALAAPLVVQVTDAYGNAREGDAVAWSSASGSLSGGASTGGDGTAAATWTLGAAPGAQTATATSSGMTQTFTANGECFDGYGMASVDGDFGAGEWACANSADFTANISGGDAAATVYWMNDGANLYMAVRVQQSSFDKANSLLVDFDNDGDGFLAQNDDAIGYEADGGTFTDRYVTRKCLNNSQSGCGADDNSVDGAGAAANDGTWTTYELSHPLDSGDSKDIAVAAGDQLGFFLTLRIGNGAQGNTQWPGFRSFQNMTIVGF